MNIKSDTRSFYLPLRAKLIILFVIFIIIPFGISGFVTYNKYTYNVEKSMSENAQQLVSQININMDNYMKDLNKLTLIPFYDSQVMDILRNHKTKSQESKYVPGNETAKMDLFIASLAYDRPEVKGIFIFTNDGVMFSNLDLQLNINKNENMRWLDISVRNDLEVFLIPPHHAAYYKDKNEMVFSIIREIKDPYSQESLGVVKIDLMKKVFDRVLDISSNPASGNIYITDWNGNIFYPSIQQGKVFNLPDKGSAEISGNKYLTSFQGSYVTGLNVIGIIDKNELKKDAIELIRFTLLISIVCLITAVIIVAFVSSRITIPVRHLQKKMKRVQMGNLDERATIISKDEVGDLSRGFNVMMDDINRLLKEVYETKLRERDAELSALQSQINPHFLYNTFELVNMIALENNQFEICDIISSLGKLLRYTVDKKERPMLLKEEVLFLKAYRKILFSRYGERIKINFLIDPYLEYCLIPKLILQPLVENAVQHGINENKGNINIIAERDNDNIILSVEDDGVGFNEEAFKILEQKIYSDESYTEESEDFGTEKKGYALRNVHQRIRLLYGEQYGLSIDTSIKQGCKFIIRLPCIFSESRGSLRNEM